MKILLLVIDGLIVCSPACFNLMKRVTCRKSQMIKWCQKCSTIHSQDSLYCNHCGSAVTWARSSSYKGEHTVITENGFVTIKPSADVHEEILKAGVSAAKTVKMCCQTIPKLKLAR